MEILYTVAAVAALVGPGWLFRRMSMGVGSLVTFILWFCAGFLGSLAEDADAVPQAVGWGATLGVVGGLWVLSHSEPGGVGTTASD
jgi:hypothetical protein